MAVKDRTPVRGTYRGVEIISAPLPSSGGAALIESLNILGAFDLAQAGLGSARSVHLIAESYRRAFFDRAQFMGDPDVTCGASTAGQGLRAGLDRSPLS